MALGITPAPAIAKATYSLPLVPSIHELSVPLKNNLKEIQRCPEHSP